MNALSNSKRAINCQIDKMLLCYGINAKKWKLTNLPKKLELLQELNIIAPNIVRKIIRMRNDLEHEYKHPEKEKVEDAIDISNLFIEASNRKLEIWEHFYIVDKEYEAWDFENDIDIWFFQNKSEFKIIGHKNYKKIGENIINTTNKEEYKALLKLAISPEDEIGKETVQYLITLTCE